MSSILLTVNGVEREVVADPDTPLLSVLRHQLGLVGSRFGCGVGLCGACVVQVDAAAVPSCETPLWSVEGRSVVTVEGLADGLHRVQERMLAEQAAQCGSASAASWSAQPPCWNTIRIPTNRPSSALWNGTCAGAEGNGGWCERWSGPDSRTRRAMVETAPSVRHCRPL